MQLIFQLVVFKYFGYLYMLFTKHNILMVATFLAPGGRKTVSRVDGPILATLNTCVNNHVNKILIGNFAGPTTPVTIKVGKRDLKIHRQYDEKINYM